MDVMAPVEAAAFKNQRFSYGISMNSIPLVLPVGQPASRIIEIPMEFQHFSIKLAFTGLAPEGALTLKIIGFPLVLQYFLQKCFYFLDKTIHC